MKGCATVTFVINSELALSDSINIKVLSTNASLSPIVDFGFNNSMINDDKNLPDAETQLYEMQTVTDTLSKLLGRKISGVLADNGKYDQNTLKALSLENLTYLITDSLTDRSVPQKVIMGERPVYIITKTARDDKTVIGKYGLVNADFQKYTYKEDVDRILFEGGLYVMKFHNEYQLKPEYVGVIKEVVDYVRSKNIWFASIDNIVKWWQKQSGIELRYETRSKRRISVEVSNHDEYTTDSFIVQIFLNKNVSNIEISADMIHTTIPKFEFDSTKNILYLHINNLESDETRTFLVDFDNIDQFNKEI